MDCWYVYILECSDETLYTGISKNVSRRLKEHNSGRGAKYTKGRRPVSLVYTEETENRSQATKRENEIKSMTKSEKEKLIS